jgi:hypothetical protein
MISKMKEVIEVDSGQSAVGSQWLAGRIFTANCQLPTAYYSKGVGL